MMKAKNMQIADYWVPVCREIRTIVWGEYDKWAYVRNPDIAKSAKKPYWHAAKRQTIFCTFFYQ